MDDIASEDFEHLLAGTRLFEGISPKGLKLVASIAKKESVSHGSTIFREGDAGDTVCLIIEGKVRISTQVSGMGEEALAVLGPGSVFGEMSLIDDFPRSADAHAHTDCLLLILKKDELEDLLFVHKDLAYEFLWNFVALLSSRLRETNAKVTFLSMSGKFQ
ncbi:MAG: cyclic nucleotide-binding domain-containing protein [Myxococcales bacterium]|nr:cyclic nucleotide-binding domain-containing protein [Myxococcales bacterium]